eukprot:c32080_g1_i1.p1 GENE.c32080_g1_i1~~c32080_g1_i1.p1  ORF type:complete len:1363 (-),score=228.54 c32080_g1_i1:31-4119(-)
MARLRSFVAVFLLAASTSADTWIWGEPIGSAPHPRFAHSASRIGNQLFVFGGTLTNNETESDLHILNMDTQRWSKPAVSGNKPAPTMGHSAVVWQESMYIFFGSDGHIMTSSTYELDTDTLVWSKLKIRGRVPTPRAYHTTIVSEGQVFVFGGFDGRSYLNDLHRWVIFDAQQHETGSWEKIEQKGVIPEIRASAAATVYDKKMYMFGGFEVTIYKDDFFVLNLETFEWSRIFLTRGVSASLPSPRAMASLTLVGTRLVLYGGIYCSSNGTCVELSDVHQFDTRKSAFQCDQATGLVPPGRYGHSAIPLGSKVLIFGGSSWPILLNDLPKYDVYDNAWSLAESSPPYARKLHTLNAFQPAPGVSQLVMFGGRQAQGYSNHLHIFDIGNSSWHHVNSQGVIPPAMSHHATLVRDNTTLYLFPGYDGNSSIGGLYSCDLVTLTWQRYDVNGQVPNKCHGHAVVSATDRFYQFGGVDCQDECSFFNTLHSLTYDSLTWASVTAVGVAPSPRASHSFVSVSPGRHLLFGGTGQGFVMHNDLYEFNSDGESWVALQTKGPKPEPRFDHAAAVMNGRLFVFGGATCTGVHSCSYFNDVFTFDPALGTWSVFDVHLLGPHPRQGAAMTAVNSALYLAGGAAGDSIFGEILTIARAVPVASKTILFGDGVTEGQAGKNTRVFAQLVDMFDQNRTSGGDSVTAVVKPTSQLAVARMGRQPIEVLLEDLGNGIYKIEYSTNVSDTYNVTVTVNGEAMDTIQVLIVPYLACPGKTEASGRGLRSCIAGVACDIEVQLIDKYYNPLIRPAPIDIQIIGARRVEKNETAVGGLVKVSYMTQGAGDYVVNVRIRGNQIQNSPFKLKVLPTLPSPKTSKLDGPALFGSRAGEEVEAVLTLFDEFTNAITSGGDKIEATLTAQSGTEAGIAKPCTIIDNKNGAYNIKYLQPRAGTYDFAIKLDGQHVATSPYLVHVLPGAVSPSTTFAHGTGLRYSVAGYRSHFVVQTADAFGNNVTSGGSKLNVLYVGPGQDKQVCDIKDNRDGTYSVSYLTTVAGDFMISATLWNEKAGYQSIHLSPFLGNTVAAGADPTRSFLYAEHAGAVLAAPDSRFRVVMGVHQYFHIQGVDRYGNKKTSGGDRFSVQLEGPTSREGFVSDSGDGTYIGAYVAPSPGRYLLKVFYGNVPVNGTPIIVDARSSFDTCPKDCSNHGVCRTNVCTCYAGYTGEDCSIEVGTCPNNCMGNGACLNGTCQCYPGFVGVACETTATVCPNDCSKHGHCQAGRCLCEESYSGIDCSEGGGCPNACRGNGECIENSCLCYPGYSGPDCQKSTLFCPSSCTKHGHCLSSGVCSCFPGWTGLDCAEQINGDEALLSLQANKN